MVSPLANANGNGAGAKFADPGTYATNTVHPFSLQSACFSWQVALPRRVPAAPRVPPPSFIYTTQNNSLHWQLGDFNGCESISNKPLLLPVVID
eukprot:1494098-Pleurochrysis_carterae.AAC.1